MTRRRQFLRRKLGLCLSWAVLAVQVLLPLLVAVEIGMLAEDPLLAGGLDPALTCSHRGDGQPAAPKHRAPAACPLCVALAAGQATTLTAAASVPPPRGSGIVADAAPAPMPPASRHRDVYEARGPPARA